VEWPEFKPQYHTQTNKKATALPWQKKKKTWTPVEQDRRSNMNLCSYAHLIFDKGAQNMWWRKDSLFSKCCLENWISACRKLTVDPYLSPCTSINSKCIKDLNITPETLKLVQEGAGNTWN
jgi:hypothetical protein